MRRGHGFTASKSSYTTHSQIKVDKRRVLHLSTDNYSTLSFLILLKRLKVCRTKGFTRLSNNGVVAATLAMRAVLTSCGGFGMYCSMNLTSS